MNIDLGYSIPKGTMVVSQNQIACRLEEFCPHRPGDFVPQRWLDRENKPHPFLSLPFGFGPRMCIGLLSSSKNVQYRHLEKLQQYSTIYFFPRTTSGRNRPSSVAFEAVQGLSLGVDRQGRPRLHLLPNQPPL